MSNNRPHETKHSRQPYYPAWERLGLVERNDRLSNLSPQFQGQQRRRHRGPERNHRKTRLPARAGDRNPVAQSDLRIPQRRQRLRHQRLPADHARFRHDGGFRPAPERSTRTRHASPPRPGAESHQRPASLVPRGPHLSGKPLLRLLPLVARGAGPSALPQEPFRRGGRCLVLQRPHAVLLPALLRPAAARPQLAESRGAGRNLRHSAFLARQGGRWIPAGFDSIHCKRHVVSGDRPLQVPGRVPLLLARAAPARLPARK